MQLYVNWEWRIKYERLTTENEDPIMKTTFVIIMLYLWRIDKQLNVNSQSTVCSYTAIGTIEKKVLALAKLGFWKKNITF